jgi:hypothetical protein
MEPLAGGLGALLNLQVNVAELTGMEDGMSGKQHGSPVSGWLSPAAGGSDAPAV